jgi:hypothetical protein
MSLKWFHLFFIGICVLMAVLVASWAVDHARWLLALVAIAGGSALVLYRRSFLRTTRELGHDDFW